ncbi:hypothetical protein M885DRAFT_521375, partial [Pelagophyceae sp. CCMP2097]
MAPCPIWESAAWHDAFDLGDECKKSCGKSGPTDGLDALRKLAAPGVSAVLDRAAAWEAADLFTLAANVSETVASLAPGNSAVVRCGPRSYVAVSRRAAGEYDLGYAATSGAAAAWQPTRVDPISGGIERDVVSVVRKCDTERLTAAATWVALLRPRFAVPDKKKPGADDDAMLTYASILSYVGGDVQPGGVWRLAPREARPEARRALRAAEQALAGGGAASLAKRATAGLEMVQQTAATLGAAASNLGAAASNLGAAFSAAPAEEADDLLLHDASGCAALLGALEFALGEAAALDLRLRLANAALAELDARADDAVRSLGRGARRALLIGVRRLGHEALRCGAPQNVLQSVEAIASRVRAAVSAGPPRQNASSTGGGMTEFSLFDGFCDVVDEDKLAGPAASDFRLNRPPDIARVGGEGRLETMRQCLDALKAANDACTLLANNSPPDDAKSRLLRRTTVEHLALRVLPLAAAPAAMWDDAETTRHAQLDVLRLVGLVARHYAAACAPLVHSKKKQFLRSEARLEKAQRISTASSLLMFCDAVTRCAVADGLRDGDAFARRYAGRGDRTRPGGFAAGAREIKDLVAADSETWLACDAAVCEVRAAALMYFGALADVAVPTFSFAEKGMTLGAGDGLLISELATELGYEFKGEADAAASTLAYVSGANREIVDECPALPLFRDAHVLLRLLCAPTLADVLRPNAVHGWRSVDFALDWSLDGKRRLKLAAFGLADVDVSAAGKKRESKSVFSGLLSLGAAPPQHSESGADASKLAGGKTGAISDEADVLFLEALPTFGGALGARDAELVLSYLTAPYVRIPLLLQLFSSAARFAALAAPELQRVLDSAIFEPGPYGDYEANVPTKAPLVGKNAQAATTLGLLVNELHKGPAAVRAAVEAFGCRIRELDPGSLSSAGGGAHSHSEAILYTLRLLGRLEGYVLVVLRAFTGDALRPAECARVHLEAMALALETILRGEGREMLDKWLCKEASGNRLPACCAVHQAQALSHAFAGGSDAMDSDAAARLAAAMLFLGQNQKLTAGARKRADDQGAAVDVELEVYSAFSRKRWSVLAAVRGEFGAGVLEFAVAAVTQVDKAQKADAQKPNENRRWVELSHGKDASDVASRRWGVARFSPEQRVLLPAVEQGGQYEAWLGSALSSVSAWCDVEVDLQVGALVVRSAKLGVLEDDIARRGDFTELFGEDELQCAVLADATRRRQRRLVGQRHDVALWTAWAAAPPTQAGSMVASVLAGVPLGLSGQRPAWANRILQEHFAAWILKNRSSAVKLPLPRWADCAEVRGDWAVMKGTFQGFEAKCVVTRRPESSTVFRKVVHGGRAAHWALVFSSDASMALDDGNAEVSAFYGGEPRPLESGSGDDDEDAAEDARLPGRISYGVEANEPSLVVTRAPSNGGADERLCPHALLRGLLPTALVTLYRFWWTVPAADQRVVELKGEPLDVRHLRVSVSVDRQTGRAGVSRADGRVLVNVVSSCALASEAAPLLDELRKLETAAWTVVWRSGAGDWLVELPRLGLTFAGDGTRLESRDFAEYTLDAGRKHAPRLERLVRALPHGVVLYTATADALVVAPATVKPVVREGSTDVALERNDRAWLSNCGAETVHSWAVHLSTTWMTSPTLAAALHLLLWRSVDASGDGDGVVSACAMAPSVATDKALAKDEAQLWQALERVTADDDSADTNALRLRLALATRAAHPAMRAAFCASAPLRRAWRNYARSANRVDARCRLAAEDELRIAEIVGCRPPPADSANDEFAASDAADKLELWNRRCVVSAVAGGLRLDGWASAHWAATSSPYHACRRGCGDVTLDVTALHQPQSPRGESNSAGPWSTEALGVVDGHHRDAPGAGRGVTPKMISAVLEGGVDLRLDFVLIYELLVGQRGISASSERGGSKDASMSKIVADLLLSCAATRFQPAGLLSVLQLLSAFPVARRAAFEISRYEATIADEASKLDSKEANESQGLMGALGLLGKVKGGVKHLAAAGQAFVQKDGTVNKDVKALVVARANEHLLRRIAKVLRAAVPAKLLTERLPFPLGALEKDRTGAARDHLDLLKPPALDSKRFAAPRWTNACDRSEYALDGQAAADFGCGFGCGRQVVEAVGVHFVKPPAMSEAYPFDLDGVLRQVGGAAWAAKTLERLKGDVDAARRRAKDEASVPEFASKAFRDGDWAQRSQSVDALVKTLAGATKVDDLAFRAALDGVEALANVDSSAERALERRVALTQHTLTFDRCVATLLCKDGAARLTALNGGANANAVLQATAAALVLQGRLVARRNALAKARNLERLARAAGADEAAAKEWDVGVEACAEAVSAPRPTVSAKGVLDPRFVVFEFASAIVLRESQHALINTFVLAEASESRALVHQLVMGAGKTTVVAPLLQILIANSDRKLITAVAPRPLIEMTKAVYRAVFASPVLQRPVLSFEFERTTRADAALVSKLAFARETSGVVVAAPSAIKAFILKLCELEHGEVLAEKQAAAAMKTKTSLFVRFSNKFSDLAGGGEEASVHRALAERRVERKFYAAAFRILSEGCALLDEVDLLLHPLKSELNWPLGEKHALDFTMPSGGQIEKQGARASIAMGPTCSMGARWRLPWRAIGLIVDAFEARTRPGHNDDLAAAVRRGVEARALQCVPHLVLVDPRFYHESLLPFVATEMVDYLVEQCGGETGGVAKRREDALDYVSAQHPTPECRNAVAKLGDSDIKHLNLCRDWVLVLLPWVLSKTNRVTYGMLRPQEIRRDEPKGRRFLAVPFAGKDAPTEASEFSNPDAAIGLTALALRYEGMSRLAVRTLLVGLRDDLAQEHGPSAQRPASLLYVGLVEAAGGHVRGTNASKLSLANTQTTLANSQASRPASSQALANSPAGERDEAELRHKLWPLAAVDVRDEDQVSTLHKLLEKAPRAIERYLDEHAFPETLAYRSLKLAASGQVLGGDLCFKSRLGFSGTPNDLLPVELGAPVFAQGDDARVLSTLTCDDVCSLWLVGSDWSPTKLLDDICATAVARGRHALIDAGALVTGLSNHAVAAYLLARLDSSKYKAACFIDEIGEKKIITRSGPGASGPLALAAAGVAVEETFTFYDQSHCTGMDIPQPALCSAVVTLSKDCSFRDAAQAAFRMRGIGRGQSISWCVIPEVAELISKLAAKLAKPSKPSRNWPQSPETGRKPSKPSNN